MDLMQQWIGDNRGMSQVHRTVFGGTDAKDRSPAGGRPDRRPGGRNRGVQRGRHNLRDRLERQACGRLPAAASTLYRTRPPSAAATVTFCGQDNGEPGAQPRDPSLGCATGPGCRRARSPARQRDQAVRAGAGRRTGVSTPGASAFQQTRSMTSACCDRLARPASASFRTWPGRPEPASAWPPADGVRRPRRRAPAAPRPGPPGPPRACSRPAAGRTPSTARRRERTRPRR